MSLQKYLNYYFLETKFLGKTLVSNMGSKHDLKLIFPSNILWDPPI